MASNDPARLRERGARWYAIQMVLAATTLLLGIVQVVTVAADLDDGLIVVVAMAMATCALGSIVAFLQVRAAARSLRASGGPR